MKKNINKQKKAMSPDSKRKQKAAIINYYVKKREKQKERETKK
jgi:hypothetical protein